MTSIVTRKKKGASFTHVEKEVYHITKLFRKKNLAVSLQTKNNIGKIWIREYVETQKQNKKPKISKQ